jgi:hypothetical protein
MATNSNVFSQGSGGSFYENEVQTGFFVSFLLGLIVPGTQEGTITYYRQQSGSLGYQTDDLLLHCVDNGVTSKIIMQIKHNLVISAKGQIFQEVIEAAWKDFNNKDLFSSATDKIFIIKSDLTLDEKNHLKVILDWARVKKAPPADFINEVSRIQQKKKYFDLILGIIAAIEPDQKIEDAAYIDFLKTLYVLELDYGTDNSQQKAIIYGLINNYKQNAELSAVQVWSSLSSHLMDANTKGGVYEKNALPDEFRSIFNTANYQREVRQLQRFGTQKAEILDAIEDTIGGYSLRRDNLTDEVRTLLNATNVVVIAGDPGTGKSAVAKAVISEMQNSCDGFVLNFKSDELSSNSLTAYFSSYQIHHSLKEIFSLFGLFKSNLIYIDAMEKLLEADGLAANQLLSALKSIANVKVLITCRKSNLGLIEMKYLSPLNYAKTEIAVLTDDEFTEVYEEVPALRALAGNPRLKSLIRVPKYLDFAYRAIGQSHQNLDNISEADFRELLWQTIIENKINEFHDGLPERRSRMFVHVAVNRSKLMRPFTPVTLDDPLALEKLLKENVILESHEGGEYVPAHDVLEDWALIRYVDDCFRKQADHQAFFDELGQEPSMRRAYRIWVQSVLQTRAPAKLTFVMGQLFTANLDSYWRDESLIAILYSEYCAVFFEQYRTELVKNDYRFLFHLIQIMRTACRENIGNFYAKNYLPRGYGWTPVFQLILADFEKISNEQYDLIYQILGDWSKIVNSQEVLPEGTRIAGLILLKLLGKHISLDGYRNSEADAAVELLCLFAGGLIEEITAIIKSDKPEDNEEVNEDDPYADSDYFFEGDKLKTKIIKVALNGPACAQLCKYMPDTVIALANEHWFHRTCAVRYPETEHDRMMYQIHRRPGRSTDVNIDFGLRGEDRLEYFPGSAYQTPALWLLRFHPLKAVRFITDMVNWCAESYRYSDFAADDAIGITTLHLNDDTKVINYGSDHLWQVFRGTGRVSPYLLQSVLMALEKYLLELGAEGEKNREALNNLTDFLFRSSMSVMTTAVISSVAQAYPAMADNFVVPLYADHKFISYDISRFVHDKESTMNTFHALHDQERLAANGLPHRKKYYGGLRNFINFYCFNYGAANLQLFALFDKLRANADQQDMNWLKMLDEMDIRTWRITKTVKSPESTNFIIEPVYQDEHRDYVADLKEEQAKMDGETTQFNWLHKVQKREMTAEITFWREVYTYYIGLESYSIIHHRPSMVAEIGIKFLWVELTEEEKHWCKQTIFSILEQKVGKAYRPFDLDLGFSSMDFDSAMEVFPLLTTLVQDEEQKEFERLALYFLTTPFQENDPDVDDFYQVFKKDMWNLNEGLAYKGIYGLVRFAEFHKKHATKRFRPRSEAEEKEYSEGYNVLIESVVTGTEVIPEIDKITAETHALEYLIRATKILPDKTDLPLVYQFTEKVFNLCLAEMWKDKDDLDRSQLNYRLKWVVEEKVSSLIFWNRGERSNHLFEHFIKAAHNFIKLSSESKKSKVGDFIKFFFSIAEKLINIADKNLPLDKPEETNHTVACFAATWTKFDEISRALGSKLFGSTILLSWDITWRQDVTSWPPIEGQREKFIEYIKLYGEDSLHAVVNLLSHIGDQTLLMPMLNWLIEKLKAENRRPAIMLIKHIEQLVGRVYYNHLNELLQDQTLFTNYLWLLDQMIEQQSSDAYWLREFIVHLNMEKRQS